MPLDLSHILENLTKIAKEEGRFSQNEENFLNNLRKDIEIFQESVNIASQDGHITDDQVHEIIIKRDKILTNSLQFNNESAEVENLIRELYNEINEFMIPGMDVEDEEVYPGKFKQPFTDESIVEDSPVCTWCKHQAGYSEEEGKFDSKWGATVHRVKIFICKHCGYSHLFSLGKSIWDFD